MALDPSISLQAKTPQVDYANAIANAQQLYTNELAIKKAQREQQQQNALRELFAKSRSSETPEFMRQVYAIGGPDVGLQYEQGVANLQKNRYAAQAEKVKALRPYAAAAAANPTWDNIRYNLGRAVDDGVMDVNVAAQFMGQLRSQPQSEWANVIRNTYSSLDEQVRANAPLTQYQQITTGMQQEQQDRAAANEAKRIALEERRVRLAEQTAANSGAGAGAGAKPITAAQAQAVSLYGSARNAENVISSFEKGVDPETGKKIPVTTTEGIVPLLAGNLPMVGDAAREMASPLQSDAQQRIGQAQKDFAMAAIYFRTGKTATEKEIRNTITTLFPKQGDSPATIRQKAASRRAILEGMETSSGGSATPKSGASAQPNVQSLLNKYK